MNIHKLDLSIPDDFLLEAFEESSRVKRFGGMTYRKPVGKWGEWLHDWFEENFQSNNIDSKPKIAFLETPPNSCSQPHVDILNADENDGRGRRIHVRQSAINITLPTASGCFEYVTRDGEVLSQTDYTGLAIYKTDVHHRANNENSDIPRRILSIGFYKDSYEKLGILNELGKLLR